MIRLLETIRMLPVSILLCVEYQVIVKNRIYLYLYNIAHILEVPFLQVPYTRAQIALWDRVKPDATFVTPAGSRISLVSCLPDSNRV